MAIDKTKVAQNAQKLVQKGQLDKAIKEYALLVQADPKDFRSHLKIAELHSKLNQKAEAVKTFRQVADLYSKAGFYTKAAAVLRQAIEVDAKQVELYTVLAELNHKLGLVKDAVVQLNTAARLLADDGKHTQAIEVLEKMREMDPDDPSVLARYAEALYNSGQKAKAVEIFRSLIANLKKSNNNDDLIRFCERILTINPDDVEALRDLSRAYLKIGLANKAQLKLKALFDRNIIDEELYDLLDRSYAALGKEEKAVHVQVEKAKYLLSQGKADVAKKTYEHVLERDPQNADALAFLRPSRAAAPRPTAPAAAPARPSEPQARPSSSPARPPPLTPQRPSAAAPPGPQTTAAKQLSKFLTEADVYLKYGLRDKAIEQLESVLRHDPNNVAARRKLVEIYAEDNPAKAAEHLRALAEVSESLGEMDQAAVYLKRAKELGGAPADTAVETEGVVIGGDDDQAETESGFIDEGDVSVEAAFAGDQADIEIESEPEPEPEPEEAIAEEPEEAEEEDPFGGDEEFGADVSADDFAGLTAGLSDEKGAGTAEASGVLDIDGQGPSIAEELDEAEFYIQQNILPEARAIYERVLARKPGHQAATEKLAWITSQMAPKAAPKPAPKAAAPKAAAKPAAEQAPEPLFDLAAELEEELDFGEQAAAPAEADEPPSFEDIFSQFKKGVARELKDDAGAHYDLGIAYKEMGLVNDAIGEFEIARKDKARESESSNMIAVCYQELGELEKAIEYYRLALDCEGTTPEAALNTNYEMACLYESLGDVRSAVGHFKKVIEQDKTYRDVGERIRALKARVQSGKAIA